MFGSQREHIVKPMMLRLAGDNQLRHFLRPHGNAVDLDVRKLRERDFVDATIDLGQLLMDATDSLLQYVDMPDRLFRDKLRHLMLNGFNGRLKLANTFPVIPPVVRP